jgi:molecular chaperone GrpE
MTRMDTDDDQPADRGPDNPTDDDLEKLRKERDELFHRLMRTAADFKNSQRRLEQEKEQALQFANSNLVKALLPVIDNFERALAVDADKTDVAAVLKGMEIVQHQLTKLLSQQHVTIISPNPGDAFDPTKHEALMQQPSDQYKDHSVLQVLQKGYAMHGRTLRPASVIVSINEKDKGPRDEAQGENDDANL